MAPSSQLRAKDVTTAFLFTCKVVWYGVYSVLTGS